MEVIAPRQAWLCLTEGASRDFARVVDVFAMKPSRELPPCLPPMAMRLFFRCERDALQALARQSEGYADPEVACHLFVGDEKELILEWYDLPGDSLSISPDLREGAVTAFAERLQATLTFHPS